MSAMDTLTCAPDTGSPFYLNEQELVRRLNVLQQDADGGIYQQYAPLISETLEKGVPVQAVDNVLKELGFTHTCTLLHNDLVKKMYAKNGPTAEERPQETAAPRM